MKLLVVMLLVLTSCGWDYKSDVDCVDGCPQESKRSKNHEDTTGPIGPMGPKGESGQDGKDGMNGQNGINGQNGQDGKDGQSAFCTVTPISEGVVLSCTGNDPVTIYNGPKGDTGEQGIPGVKGDTGETGGQGPQGDTGPQGEPGLPGQNGTDAIIEIIDPCGPSSSDVDELLFRLSTGELVAWYKNVGLVALSNGNYVTTDQQKCYFTISNGQILNEHE